jgi:hypothetical protein
MIYTTHLSGESIGVGLRKVINNGILRAHPRILIAFMSVCYYHAQP